ncbi:hypothetical protein ACF0H5_012510 [Mactra antiquata]
MDSKNIPGERIYYTDSLSTLPPERSDIQQNLDQSLGLSSMLYQGINYQTEKQSPVQYGDGEVIFMSSKQAFIDPSYEKNRLNKKQKLKIISSQDATCHSFSEENLQSHQLPTRNVSHNSYGCYSDDHCASEMFSCGLCLLVYDSICQLHFHMKDKHNSKKYTIDLILGSAFPIAEMKTQCSQTDVSDLDVNDFVPIKCELSVSEDSEMTERSNEDNMGQFDCQSFNKGDDLRNQITEFQCEEIEKKFLHKDCNNADTNSNDPLYSKGHTSYEENGDKSTISGINKMSPNSDVAYIQEYEASTDEDIDDCRNNITFKKDRQKKRTHLPSSKKRKRQVKKCKNKQTKKADINKSDTTSMFECEMCGTKYSLMSRLRYHMMKVHSKMYDGTPRHCKWCGRTQKGLRSYLAHVRQCEKNENRMCFICEQYFQSKTEIMDHLASHKNDANFNCIICQKTFRSAVFLHHHLRRHNKTKTVQCEHCGKSFVYQYELTKHLDCCNKDPFIECDQCDLKFKTENALQNHKLVHSDHKPYVCHICGHAAKKAAYLVRHIRVHTGERPYPCPDCGKRFPALTGLNRHKRIHTNNKPYACTYCDKAFKTNWSLKTHLRQHTGDTPYKCELCNKAFKQNVLLKLHLKSHQP